jgi:hypothetical protein
MVAINSQSREQRKSGAAGHANGFCQMPRPRLRLPSPTSPKRQRVHGKCPRIPRQPYEPDASASAWKSALTSRAGFLMHSLALRARTAGRHVLAGASGSYGWEACTHWRFGLVGGQSTQRGKRGSGLSLSCATRSTARLKV